MGLKVKKDSSCSIKSPNFVTTRSYGKMKKVCLQVWCRGATDYLVMFIDNCDLVLDIVFFFFKSYATASLKANVLMIMDDASPCMVPFVIGKPTEIA